MTDFLTMMVNAELRKNPPPTPEEAHLRPIYFTPETQVAPDPYFADLIDISRRMWSYNGYTGLMKPWHDEDPYKFLRIRRDSFRSFFYEMEQDDINWQSYCVLLFLMTDYELWERPTLLVMQRAKLSWFRRLRASAGTRERFDRVASFMLEFLELQVQRGRGSGLTPRMFVAADPTKGKGHSSGSKYLVIYHRTLDRISALEQQGIDPIEWLRTKHARFVEWKPAEVVPLSAILNVNGLDPEVEELRAQQADLWKEIRKFLGLTASCKFENNCVPKGWRPSSDDFDDLSKVVSITADGYYYRADGTQRRGRRHYATNKYFNICCIPGNFEQFKKSWDDPRFLTATPTWEEYSKWGLYPNIWNEKGVNISRYTALKNVHWRTA